MPFTFLAHQAPVLPLALVWPRRFDALALCVGSMAPDVAYVAAGTRWAFATHSAWGLVWFCLPLTLLVAALVRRAAPTWLVHLPLPGALRRGGAALLGPAPPLQVTLVSALIGAGSHVVLDAFTHRRGFFVLHCPALEAAPLPLLGRPVPVYSLLQGPGSLVLALLALLALRALAGRGPARPLPTPTLEARRRFTRAAVLALVLALALALAAYPLGGIPALILRLAVLGFLALVLAAVVAREPLGFSEHPR